MSGSARAHLAGIGNDTLDTKVLGNTLYLNMMTTEGDGSMGRIHRSRGSAWLLAVMLAVGSARTASTAEVRSKPASEPPRRTVASALGEVLVAVEDAPWTAAVAAPVAAHVQHSGRLPFLMAISNPPTHEADWWLTMTGSRRVTVFVAIERLKLSSTLTKVVPEQLQIGTSPVEGSLVVAKRFWKQSHGAVVAAADDPEAIILGGALAASLAEPLLIRDRTEGRTALGQVLHDLGVDQAVVAASDPANAPVWARSKKYKTEVLGPQALQHRLVAAIGPEQVRSVVVARVPQPNAGIGQTAWLAPYMSLARSAAVVMAHSASPTAAEADVAALIDREGLRPKTVTILADYGSIGNHLVEIDPEDPALRPDEDSPTRPARARRTPPVAATTGGTATGSVAAATATVAPASSDAPPTAGAAPAAAVKTHYVVRTEPCVPREVQKLAEFGVGRIPLESLADASVLFARGILRDRLLVNRPPRLLMVSNSGPIRRPLPLCETISRITASELKNFGLHVDEYYGMLADSPDILTAAKTATWIIYEGHLAYQDLIDVPAPRRTSAQELYFNDELDDLEGGDPNTEPVLPKRTEQPVSRPPRSVVVVPESKRLQGPLLGLPVVILQSCDSLEEPVLWRLDELGGVAVIGSVTPIHSGSGSSLIHAAVGAVLYRGGTLGEALRDAQNYMFCLEDLKARRGHKEQAKGRRVALSFRLWGDPELRVFPVSPGIPLEAPVSVAWTSPDTMTITVPKTKLPEARSNKYVAQMFPGCQAAGMVKSREGDTLRQLAPVYYFRVPLPDGFAFSNDSALQPAVGDPNRASFRIDRLGRMLYVVYFPEQEKPGDSIVLRWTNSGKVESARRATP